MKLTGQRNQCPTCAEYFNSNAAFERHRHGAFGADRRCLTVDETAARGMSKNSAGFWVTQAWAGMPFPALGSHSGADETL